MPKKILIITECFYPEEFKINDVALAWKKKGFDVSVLTLVPSYPLGEVFSGYKNNGFFLTVGVPIGAGKGKKKAEENADN